MFDMYSKFDGQILSMVPSSKDGLVTMSYKSFLKMGQNLGIWPKIIGSQDFIYIYKTQMKTKKQQETGVQYETLKDVEGTRLNYSEFKEILFKIACLGKLKLGSRSSDNKNEAEDG